MVKVDHSNLHITGLYDLYVRTMYFFVKTFIVHRRVHSRFQFQRIFELIFFLNIADVESAKKQI